MKPNNISDIEKIFAEVHGVSENAHSWVKEFYRSQIEQLLGRIDTSEIGGEHPTGYLSERSKGKNQKSSEIASQIESMLK
jgi:hypothetical protein